MIDEPTAKKLINEMPWNGVPKPILFMMAGENGGTRVHLHKPVSKGWKNAVALIGRCPEGVLGAALEGWIALYCPSGEARDKLLAHVRKLLN